MIYFFDNDKKYIGCRELSQNELCPAYATTVSPKIEDGQQAHFINGSWVVSDIPVVPEIDFVAPEPSPDERLDVLEPTVESIIVVLEASV